MKILIIPELTNKEDLFEDCLRIEHSISKNDPRLKIANIPSWSLLSPIKPESVFETLVYGSNLISQTEYFQSFTVYIGLLTREDIPRVSTIIFTSPLAKEIYETRELSKMTPFADEIVVINGEMTIENEIYKRTIIHNIVER